MRNRPPAGGIPPGHSAAAAREELWNALTHGVGVIGSLAAGTVLITLSAALGEARHVVAASIFTATLVLLYAASTLFHAVRDDQARDRLRIFDHSAIYLLIAGTYTPFTLVALRGAWGWSLFGVVWGLAAAGVVFKLFFAGRFRVVSTLLYIGLGWMALIAYRPLSQALSGDALALLAAGGVAYTAGTLFYLNRSLPYSHAVWHLFVLGGSVCHFAAVARVLL